MSKPTVAELARELEQLRARVAELEAGQQPEDPARAGFLTFRQRARAIEDRQIQARRGE